jgi:hypothetical protein
MNIYHRFIKLPFVYEKPSQFLEGSESFINYFSKEKVNHVVVDWLAKYNLRISNVVEGFYTSANNKVSVPIHNDVTVFPGVHDAVKLNFTWGPSESKTRWWQISDESKLIEVNHDTNSINEGLRQAGIEPDIQCDKCYTAKEEHLKLVHEVTVDKPSLINVGQLHSTYNPNPTEDRWTLSFTMLNNKGEHLSFNEALEVFKEVIYE